MGIIEVIMVHGHPRITARHPTTLMITKDAEVGPRGDCIVAVAADKGAAELSGRLKSALKSGVPVEITIEAGKEVEKISAIGHPSLVLTHPRDLVIRKSGFVCGRTLAIHANKAAADLSRKLVAKLRGPSASAKITIEAKR